MTKRIACIATVAALLALGTTSCGAFRRDRCYIDPVRYEQAQLLYEKTCSLALVEDMLREQGWKRCELNELRYRLTKEVELDLPRSELKQPRRPAP